MFKKSLAAIVSAAVLVVGPGHLTLTAAAQATTRGPVAGVTATPTIGTGLNSPLPTAFFSSRMPNLVTGVLTAPSLPTTPRVAAPAPAAPQPLGAKSMLHRMQTVAVKNVSVAPFYTGAKNFAEPGSVMPVMPEALGSGDGTRLAPVSRPSQVKSARAVPPSRSRQVGKVSAAVLVVVGLVVAVAITVGVIWHNGNTRNGMWQNSKSNQDIVAIEKARRDGDADALAAIVKDARDRQARMAERIAAAKSAGSKKVGDATGDDVKTAEAFKDFDGLAGARAELNLNAVSQDPARRIGEQLPATWKESLAREEAEAKKTGFEGSLALQLQAMRGELERETNAGHRIAGDIDAFKERVPGMFGGRLKEMGNRGDADLAEYRRTEISPENGRYNDVNSAMRGRVSAKLASQSEDYQKHLARQERLAGVADLIKPAVEMALQVDKDLKEMGEHEHARAANLILAANNERVRVDDYDQNGKLIGSHEEDHSGMYKAFAASEGAAARASAASAQAGIKGLHVLIPMLRKDKTMIEEGLVFALPNGTNNTNPNPGGSVFFDFWIPASWNLFGMMFSESQAAQARGSFGSVLGGLQGVQAEVANRQAGETNWVNGAIDADLDTQMKQAPAEGK